MQIIYNCQIQRKNRSHENQHHYQVSNILSRSNILHQNESRFKLKQKMRKQLSVLSAQLIQLSPNSEKDSANEVENDKYTINKVNFQQSVGNFHAKSHHQKGKNTAKYTSTHHQYAINIPIQIISEEQIHEYDGLNNTGEIMDKKFDRILQLNYASQDLDILQIESKFNVIKSQNYLRQPQFFEPDIKPQSVRNIHEKLLEEENHYIRQQLMQFMQVIERNKQYTEEINHKYRKVKKQKSNLVKQLGKINQMKSTFEREVGRKDAVIQSLTHNFEENQKHMLYMLKERQFCQAKIEKLQKSCMDFEQELQKFELKKDKEVQALEEEKIRLKQELQDALCQKQKQITQLNQYILQLKSKLQAQKYHKDGQDIIVESTQSRDDEGGSKIFQSGTNSICLSLAEAESLKNIIQQKQQLHKAEIMALKQQFFQKESQIQRNIEKIQLKLKQLQKVNQSLANDNQSKQKTIEYLQNMISSLSDIAETTDILQECNGPQQLLKLGYSRRIKKLQRHIVEARQEKMELISKINELQQKFLSGEKEQDEELEQLLENCVNQLQKERQLTYVLKNQNQYLKQLMCKQQMLTKTMTNCIYN